MEARFLKSHTAAKKRSSAGAEERLKAEGYSRQTDELLRGAHFRSLSRLDFLELRKRAQTGWFRLTGAAAGRGQQRENGSDKCGENTGHGIK